MPCSFELKTSIHSTRAPVDCSWREGGRNVRTFLLGVDTFNQSNGLQLEGGRKGGREGGREGGWTHPSHHVGALGVGRVGGARVEDSHP